MSIFGLGVTGGYLGLDLEGRVDRIEMGNNPPMPPIKIASKTARTMSIQAKKSLRTLFCIATARAKAAQNTTLTIEPMISPA